MYTLGGATGVSFPAGVTTADKSDMAAETTSAVATANLSGNRAAMAGAANPGVAGYCCGGTTTFSSGTDLATCDKTTFSNDTTSATASGNLSQARWELCALSERTTKAYWIAGGHLVAGILTAVKTADVLTFSGDSTAAQTSADLTTAVKFPAGMNGGSTKGYVAGGAKTTASDVVVTAYKVTFSGDSTATQASANLTVARFGSYAGFDGSTKGYWVGGQNGSPLSTIDKIVVSTDTTSAISATMSRNEGSSGSDGTKLVCFSGSISDPAGQKITFATDTVVGFGTGGNGNLSVARQACTGFSTVAL